MSRLISQALTNGPIEIGNGNISPQEFNIVLRVDAISPYDSLLQPEPDGIRGDFKYPGDIIYR